MHSIIVREQNSNDIPFLNEIVKNGYVSLTTQTFVNALFKEVTFQLMVITAAVMFIFLGVPFVYCLCCIPLVLFFIYASIYGSLLMKATEICYSKRSVKTWVAEAWEPFFFSKNPEEILYRVTTEDVLSKQGINAESCQRKVIGTISVSKSFTVENGAWLFKFVVDARYRKKGVGNMLVKTVQDWCLKNGFSTLELAISECQVPSRSIFVSRGFKLKQMYHKKMFGNMLTLLMYILESDLKLPQTEY